MAKVSIPKLTSATFKGWAFVLIAGLVLAVVALVHRGNVEPAGAATADGVGCRMEVVAAQLNVRAEPSQDALVLETLLDGAQVDASPDVIAEFRELSPGRYAADQFLATVPGTDCG